jgi:hypothetical protein
MVSAIIAVHHDVFDAMLMIHLTAGPWMEHQMNQQKNDSLS